MVLEHERAQVAAAARRVGAAGLVVGSAGNVALRTGRRLLVSGAGTVMADLRPQDVAVVELDDGEPVDGPPPSSELPLHLLAFAELPIGALVHTHSTMATAIGCVLEGELPLVHYGMLALGGAVPIAPYRRFGSPELAAVTVAALRGRGAALMANHGAVAVGGDLDVAVSRAALLEWACGVYWHAQALGTPKILAGRELLQARAAMADREPDIKESP